jgi:hypothetical protein
MTFSGNPRQAKSDLKTSYTKFPDYVNKEMLA